MSAMHRKLKGALRKAVGKRKGEPSGREGKCKGSQRAWKVRFIKFQIAFV